MLEKEIILLSNLFRYVRILRLGWIVRTVDPFRSKDRALADFTPAFIFLITKLNRFSYSWAPFYWTQVEGISLGGKQLHKIAWGAETVSSLRSKYKEQDMRATHGEPRMRDKLRMTQ